MVPNSILIHILLGALAFIHSSGAPLTAFTGTDTLVQQDKVIASLEVFPNFDLNFEVKINSVPEYLKNILHVGTSYNGDTHSRLPAIWLKESENGRYDAARLRIFISTSSTESLRTIGCVPDPFLSVGRWYKVHIRVESNFLRVSYDGVEQCVQRVPPTDGLGKLGKFWASNDRNSPADAEIRNIVYDPVVVRPPLPGSPEPNPPTEPSPELPGRPEPNPPTEPQPEQPQTPTPEQPPAQESGISILKGNVAVRKGHRLTTIDTASIFELSFDIMFTGTRPEATSVLHIGNEFSGYGARLPAVFAEGTAVEVAISSSHQTSAICKTPSLQQDVWVNIRVVVVPGAKMYVLVDGEEVCYANADGMSAPPQKGVSVWASDPWNNAGAADARVRDIRYLPL
eukprot:CAMPEP_0197515116 /NCGR_PEP_ID=MMETSP1318-20131121/341_1 /TAXON_ID=552666 /ORGANISM="Partenskyella glossopodia, Strain RCC365" /LENGTH=397 /DNA_ID=CAMNT_0043063395 /DNA_START=137 /DNA_END=1330 /DNA_ORIENTATION=-